MIRFILTVALLIPGIAFAEGRGLLSMTTFASQDDARVDHGGLVEARLEAKERIGALTGELNLLALHAVATLPPDGREVERSSALAATPRADRGSLDRLVVDRALVELSSGRAALMAGRQPVNLATCYFFTPNDLFAPFAATAYYRVYKPGVDAARLEWGVADFTQVTLLHILGYTPDATKPTGWGDLDSDRASTIVRASTLIADTVDIALLGGGVGQDQIVGGALQGDLIGGFGFRAEGHYRWIDGGENVVELALQLNRRFESSLDLTLEWFHHGAGVESVERYDPRASLPARRYGAAGASYELTPLMTVNGSIIANLIDESYLATLYGVHSLADEAEADIALSFPLSSDGAKSQYGVAPSAVSVSFRLYF